MITTTGTRRGRKPKSPGGRKKANIMLPTAVHARFTEEALGLNVPLTDVGAYYMVLGWNAAHGAQIKMPSYLQSQMGHAGLQDTLLSSAESRGDLLAS